MVDPLSIAGFTIGALGFLLTVRNGVARILEDAYVFQQHHERLFDLSARLGHFQDRIELWRKFWQVYDGCSKDLFINYWGEDGYKSIVDLLGRIKMQAVTVHEKFRRMCAGMLTEGSDSRPAQYFEEAHVDALRQRLLVYRRHLGIRKRYYATIIEDPSFRAHFNDFGDNIKALVEWSETRFRLVHQLHGNSELEAKLEPVQARNHLLQLEQSSAAASKLLRQICAETETLNVDYQLDHCSDPDERLTMIFSYVREERLVYHLRISEVSQPNNRSLRKVRKAGFEIVRQGVNRSYNTTCDNLTQLLRELNNEASLDRTRSIFLRHTFFVQNHGQCEEHVDSLRNFMALSRGHSFKDYLHGHFRKFERSKLAYELAECVLILLRSRSFSKLCACTITRIGDKYADGSYAVRLGKSQHIDHALETAVSEPWCEIDVEDMPIFRLGILLTEIVLGKPVLDLKLDGRKELKDQLEVDFNIDPRHDGELTNSCGVGEISYQVLIEAGRDFRDAIKYCLSQTVKTGDIAENVLQAFYDNVVAILYLHYQDEVIQPARRRRNRMHRRERRYNWASA